MTSGIGVLGLAAELSGVAGHQDKTNHNLVHRFKLRLTLKFSWARPEHEQYGRCTNSRVHLHNHMMPHGHSCDTKGSQCSVSGTSCLGSGESPKLAYGAKAEGHQSRSDSKSNGQHWHNSNIRTTPGKSKCPKIQPSWYNV